ncbi:hypothetical protein GALMADRAFT_142737 [Galerina marginata CBS 339.88]|uniref:RxLR effector protein n=1 Tax=Galerina marginata (strain CBS 339.88) TaxID=685588 RepID=A0A067SZE5_GALM3|nr:hypothetical protein GALMADRAFT_142737 [Galerina marginata CBS 339.88]
MVKGFTSLFFAVVLACAVASASPVAGSADTVGPVGDPIFLKRDIVEGKTRQDTDFLLPPRRIINEETRQDTDFLKSVTGN